MNVLAGVCAAWCVSLMVSRLVGRDRRRDVRDGTPVGRWASARPPRRARLALWLDQAGAGVAPSQFAAVSAGVAAATLLIVWLVSGAAAVAVVPAAVVGSLPRAWYGRQRARLQRERLAAWPQALRDLVAHLETPMSLHRSLVELGRSGPEPLRPVWVRYARLTSALDVRAALAALRDQLAHPVSDRIFEVLLVAHDQGASVTVDILRDLAEATTADLRLADQIETAQLEQRIEARSCVVLPYVVLVLLCSSSGPYRDFYATTGGWLVIAAGAAMSLVGTIMIDCLGRLPTEQRVFARAGDRP